jgi:hypothetical protein
MKPKMHHQVQPREIAPPRMAQIQGEKREVEKEIQDFLRAVNSYPARVAKEPRISFQQHLCSLFAARNNEGERDRSPHRQSSSR